MFEFKAKLAVFCSARVPLMGLGKTLTARQNAME
jgi:hypothetical protein